MNKAKKMQAGGVSHKSPKAPMVDAGGAWTKVQERNLPKAKGGACLKCGGKAKKKGK